MIKFAKLLYQHHQQKKRLKKTKKKKMDLSNTLGELLAKRAKEKK